MSVTLIATDCPAVPVPATSPLIAAGPTAAKPVATGERIISVPITENAARLDLMARYGGGGYGIARGLAISATTLAATVTAGHALMDGIVELGADTGIVLSDEADNYLWLLQDGTLARQIGSTAAPPSDPAVYLGMLRTASGMTVLADTSGVVYLRGGVLWRETADAAMPLDTPPSSLIFLTTTQGGLYLWDSTAYRTIEGRVTPGVPAWVMEWTEAGGGTTVIDAADVPAVYMTQLLTPAGDLFLNDTLGVWNAATWGIQARLSTELFVEVDTSISVTLVADNAARGVLNGVTLTPDAISVTPGVRAPVVLSLDLVAGWNLFEVSFRNDDDTGELAFLEIYGTDAPLAELVGGIRAPLPATLTRAGDADGQVPVWDDGPKVWRKMDSADPLSFFGAAGTVQTPVTYTGGTASGSYTASELQAVMDKLAELVAALNGYGLV